MTDVTVRKLDHSGQELLSYSGRVLDRPDQAIVLETGWGRDALDLGFVVLRPGDRWTEYFYADRWYNVFRIQDSEGDLKGWYCNITRPARITEREVAAEDLALDLWVAADGEILVLDEEEFAQLPLSHQERNRARQALNKLRQRVREGRPPFGDADCS